ncbi:MAG: carboxypeptidase-like regulatory domain-containing protein [Planctomycetota bacterium]
MGLLRPRGDSQAEKAVLTVVIGFTATILLLALGGIVVEPGTAPSPPPSAGEASLPSELAARPAPAAPRPRADSDLPPVETATLPAGSVYGVVLLPDGAPAAGASVRVATATPSADVESLTGTTDSEGRFLITNVPGRASLVVTARRRGYLAAESPSFEPKGETSFDAGALKLRPALSMIVAVLDEPGTTLEGVKVALSTLDAQGNLSACAEERTDAQGEAVFVALESSRLVVRVEADGYAPHEVSLSVVGVPDAAPWRKVIVLRRGEGHLQGHVVDETGAMIPGVELEATGIDHAGKARIRFKAVSASDGSFRFGCLPSLPFEIDVTGPRYYLDHPRRAKEGDEGIAVTVHPTGWLAGVLRLGGKLPGEVSLTAMRLETTGTPRPTPHRLSVIPSRAVTTFEMQGLEPGRFLLAATSEGYARAFSQPFEILPGQCTREILLEPEVGCRVTGRLHDPEGRPLPGARVVLEHAQRPPSSRVGGIIVRKPQPPRQTVTGESGAFEFSDLSAGRYRLEASWGALAPLRIEGFEVQPGGTSDLGALAVSRGGTLRGSVTDAQGRGLGRMRVVVEAAGNGSQLVLRTAEDGTFQTTALAPGHYEVAVAPAGVGLPPTLGASGEIVIEEGRQADLALTFNGR